MRVISRFLIAFTLIVPALTCVAGDTPEKAPARNVIIQAILITASAEKGATDERLAAYERNLKSSLRFESFKYVGEGTARIEMPGTADISLPQGQKLSVESAYYGEGMVWFRVIWMDGDRQFMNVVYTKWPRGKPVVVAGSARGGENLAIILTPR